MTDGESAFGQVGLGGEGLAAQSMCMDEMSIVIHFDDAILDGEFTEGRCADVRRDTMAGRDPLILIIRFHKSSVTAREVTLPRRNNPESYENLAHIPWRMWPRPRVVCRSTRAR